MAWCHPKIEFNKDVYFPGEQVTGRVTVSTEQDMTARNVEISFFGQTITAWKEEAKRRNESPDTNLYKKAEDTFLEFKNVVWKPEDENETFPSGDYEWKFSFDLPRDCSSSFEGPFGYIRYFVRVHFDVPRWLDTKVESAITVSPTIDLNSIPGANQCGEIELEKMNTKISCLPFLGNYGAVIYKINSPKVGYVSGETVHIKGTIENRSSKTLKGIEAVLQRQVIYREDMSNSIIKSLTNTPDSFNSRTDKIDFEKKTETCEIRQGETKNFEFSFEIPPVVSTIRSSKFINVEYFVTIEANRGICDTPDAALFQIIIGNVPILEKGAINLPPHKFVKCDPAKCWNGLLKPDFTAQVPFYGTSEVENDKEVPN